MPKDGRFYLRDRVTAEERQANAEYGNYESIRLLQPRATLAPRGYRSPGDLVSGVDVR
jgi:hypothetical protein